MGMETPAHPAYYERLRCPRSGQRLAPASEAVIAALEALRQQGELRFYREREEEPCLPDPLQIDLGKPITAGLLREDGRVFYVIDAGIPVLLPNHGIDHCG